MKKEDLIKAIKYCHDYPKLGTQEETTTYCEECKFNDECMSGIIDELYYYFMFEENLDFQEYCSENKILVDKEAYKRLQDKASQE